MSLKVPATAFGGARATLKAEVAGSLRELRAYEGRPVKAGEVLAAIDDRAYALRLEIVEAERLRRLSEMLAEDAFEAPGPPATERTARDRGSTGAPRAAEDGQESGRIRSGLRKADVRAAAKGVTQADAEVALARLDLERTHVRAPFAGVLTAIRVSKGESVVPGQDLFTLIARSGLRVEARVLEGESGRIRAGRDASLRFNAHPGRIFRGCVSALSPVVDPAEGTRAVHIDLEDTGGAVVPGMHAEAEIVTEVHGDRLLVPTEALLVRGGRTLVFVVEEGLARWRYVAIGLENDRMVEVLDGVREGEKVIVEGQLTLAHDTRVAVE